MDKLLKDGAELMPLVVLPLYTMCFGLQMAVVIQNPRTCNAMPIVPFCCQIINASLPPGSGTRVEALHRYWPFVLFGAFPGSPPFQASTAA